MIAISAAEAFGPAMDAARSPERRVKMKLTTRTVRHTKAASNSLRNINKCIVDNYDSEPVTASSDVEPWKWRHRNLPVFSTYARDMLANMPKPTAATAALNVYELRGSSRKLVRKPEAGRAAFFLVLQLAVSTPDDVACCEGFRMPAPRGWRGAHRGRRPQTSNGGNRGKGYVRRCGVSYRRVSVAHNFDFIAAGFSKNLGLEYVHNFGVMARVLQHLLYGLLIMGHGRRQVIWFGVTTHPTAEWIANQITEACGWEQLPRYLIRDRDGAYGEAFIRRLRSMGIRDQPTSPRSPWQNGYAERLIGSIRRECLDHVVVFGERHLRHLLLSYMDYYNNVRTHLSLAKDAPTLRPVHAVGTIRPRPILGGLHHQYIRL